MNSFKLIAIVPLKDKDGEFSKNLKTGKPYYFYKGYTIVVVNDEVESISIDSEAQPEINLYTLNNGIEVGISAVVGENGSGKSTLFELLYYMIYVLSKGGKQNDGPLQDITIDLEEQISNLNFEGYWLKHIHGAKDPAQVWKQPEDIHRELEEKFHIEGVLFAHLIRKYEISLDYNKVGLKEDVVEEVLRQLNNKKGILELRLRRAESKQAHITKFLDVSLMYEKYGVIYELNCGSGEIRHFKFGPQQDKEPIVVNFEDLFYTISLNYSHHSLNSAVLGEWITKLFHKNDAYTTPLVISPMRTNGNYDINKELRLSRERLMNTLVYDLLRKKEYSLLGKYKLKNFIFKNKRDELTLPFDQEGFDVLRSSGLLRANGIESFTDNMPLAGFALAYLEDKIERMADTYVGLIDYAASGKQPQDVQVDFINDENTHATKKIRQTVNYLKAVQRNGGRAVYPELNQAGEIIISPKELEDYIQSFPDYDKNAGLVHLMDYAMPGFLSVDFEFSAPNVKSIRLSQLSSGEQQMVFNINTVLYHLYNLQSVHMGLSSQSKGGAVASRTAYKHINIVLDEVELYYHPEMQRQLIENLIGALERLEAPKTIGISAINICVLTHSPFILSDIPIQNTLKLGGVQSFEENQTFAANIHELLRNDFFLKESFMGAFAQRRINEVIDSLQVATLISRYTFIDEHALLQFPGYDPATKTAKLSQQTCLGIIKLVGEPVLYTSLMELYLSTYSMLDNFTTNQLKRFDDTNYPEI